MPVSSCSVRPSSPSLSPPSSGPLASGAGDRPHRVLPATPEDALAITRDGLRPADVREMEVFGRDPQVVLPESLALSAPLAYTLHVDGHPAAIFGAAGTPTPSVGAVWMLGSERMYGAKRALVEEAALWMDHLNAVFPILTNFIHSENHVSLEWCRLLGYAISEPIPFNSTTIQRIVRHV